jgi:hypothetical protein
MLLNILKPYRFSDLEFSLLSQTRKIFINTGYVFDRWPEIYFNDFDDFDNSCNDYDLDEIGKDYNIYNPDLLGSYVYVNGEEGHIRLYKDRIRKCSIVIADQLNFHRHYVENTIRLIVLIHEIGHWLTHFCHSENYEIRREGFKNQEKIIKETLAQLCVLWTLNKQKKVTKNEMIIFNHLVDHQPYPYKSFRDLGRKQTYIYTLLKRYERIADFNYHIYATSFDFLKYGKKSTY